MAKKPAEQERNRETIEIGPTRWNCLGWTRITIERHGWLGQQMLESGLSQLRQKPGEVLGDFFCRFVFEAMVSGRAYQLLAGFLLPADVPEKDWTPERARQAAHTLQELYEAGHQEEIQKQLAQVGAGFLASQLLSAGSSASASAPEGETTPAERPAASTGRPPARSPSS